MAGQSFQIRSDAEEDYVRQLAADVTARFVGLREKGPRHNQDFKAMAMVAIGLLVLSDKRHTLFLLNRRKF